MAVNSTHPPLPTFNFREGELPPELIVSIGRVLDLHPGQEADPLDRLSNTFDPVSILNSYFPDGKRHTTCMPVSLTWLRHAEASLGQLAAVEARLIENEMELQREIESLMDQLRRNQDPSRIQQIQEMISVCS